MTRLLPALACAALLGLLTACASDDTAYYGRALDTETPAAAPEAAPAEPGAFPYRLGDLSPAHRPDPKSDEAGIWFLFDKAERRVKAEGRRYRDPAVNAYVKNVVCKVTGPYCKDIRVYIVRAPGLNAFMAANGMMIIQTGLLLRVQNEAQLAAIIGHEAGHYLRQHSLQRMRDVIEKTNSLFFFNFMLAASGIPLAGDLATLAVIGDIQAYGRNHEREADGYGLLLMAQAGYDPEEASKIWDLTLREMNTVKAYRERSLFFASHPEPEERMAELRNLSTRIKDETSTGLGQDRLRQVVGPIRADLLRDELYQRRFAAFDVLLDQLIEGGDNLAELYFFKAEARRLRARDDDLKEALDFYAKAEKAPGTAPVQIHKSRGLVLHKLGRTDGARASFTAYLKANPEAADAAIIRRMVKGDSQ